MRTASTARSLVALALTLGLVGATGCGSSDGGATSASAEEATVRSLDLSGFGKVVADGASKPLYVITSDPSGKSSCSGSCLKQFKPVTAPGSPSAGPGLEASELKTLSRDDGAKQLAYAGHALYTFTGEGLISGAGLKSGSGTWYLLSEKGSPIKTTAAGGY